MLLLRSWIQDKHQAKSRRCNIKINKPETKAFAPDAFLKLASTSLYRTLSSIALPSERPTPTTSNAGEETMVRTGEPLCRVVGVVGGGDRGW